jgi:WD40 repeat protein
VDHSADANFDPLVRIPGLSFRLANADHNCLSVVVVSHSGCPRGASGPFVDMTDFGGDFCEWPITFRELFLGSRGVAFVATLFPAREDPAQLLPVLSAMLSGGAENGFIELGAFDTIAHALIHTTPPFLTVALFIGLSAAGALFKTSANRMSFFHTILLNFEIWRRAPDDTQVEVIEWWSQLAAGCPEALDTLHPFTLLEICDWYFAEARMTERIREALIKLLKASMKRKLSEDALGVLLHVLKSNVDQVQHITAFVDVFRAAIDFAPGLRSKFATAFLGSHTIAFHPDPSVQMAVLKLFDGIGKTFAADFVLFNLKHASVRAPKEVSAAFQVFVTAFAAGDLSLFPMCLGFAFFSDIVHVEQFVDFLTQAVKTKSAELQEALGTFTLLLVVAFFAILAPAQEKLLLALVAHRPLLCANVFRLLDAFAMAAKVDFHNVQNRFAVALLAKVTHKTFVGEREPYFQIILDFIFFRPKWNTTGMEGKHGAAAQFLAILSALSELPPAEFKLKFIADKWADRMLVCHLAVAISSLKENASEQFLIGYSFTFHTENFQENQLPILDQIVALIPEDCPAWAALLFQAAKHPNLFPESGQFKKRFGPRLKMSHHLFEDATTEIVKFIDRYRSYSTIDKDAFLLLRSQLVRDKLSFIGPEKRLPLVREHNARTCRRLVRSWLRLERLIHYDGSPFEVVPPEEPFRKRLDASLKKWVLVPKSFQRRYPADGLLPLFSTDAERIKPNRTVKGIFSVSVSCCVFTDSDSLSFSMPKELIRFIFFSNDGSIQIFLSDFQGFLFQGFSRPLNLVLDALRELNAPAIELFQEGDAQAEISRLRLLERWEAQQISSLDLLFTINFLFGKSHFSPSKRLIFPFPPIGDGDDDLWARKFSDERNLILPWLASSEFHVTYPMVSVDVSSFQTTIQSVVTFPSLFSGIIGLAAVGDRFLAATKSGSIIECGMNSPQRELRSDCITDLIGFWGESIFDRSVSGRGIRELLPGEDWRESSLTPHFSSVTVLITSAGAVITGGADGSVAVWSSLEKCDVVFAHSGEVLSLAVSDQYGVLVSCGKDESLVVALLPELAVLRRIRLGFIAKRVAVTRGCGYIVAVGSEKWHSYTINGSQRGRIEMKEEIVDMCDVSLRNGDDYIAVVLGTSVMLCDASDFRKVALLFEGQRIAVVRWCETMNAVIAAGEDGVVIVLPVNVDQLKCGNQISEWK